jgi:hypothetical protein
MSAGPPVIVNCRDRLSCLVLLVDWLEGAGVERIILVDNDSHWEPLLDYYTVTPHTVVRLGQNLGYLAPWVAGVVDRVARNEPYVVTDPDVVPDPGCPLDAIDHLCAVLGRYSGYVKVGLGLRIDDLPACYARRHHVLAWEAQYSRRKLARGLYHAGVDTTFALYRPGVPFNRRPSIRTGAPYLARHLPWYADSARPSAEDLFYLARASADASWANNPGQAPVPPWGMIDRLKWRRYTVGQRVGRACRRLGGPASGS